MKLTSNHLVIVCGQDDNIGNGAWTDCGCGTRIVHDPEMAARAQATHPKSEVVFLCYSCATANPALIGDALRQGLRDDRGVYGTEMRDALDQIGEERIVDFLRKNSPQ